MRLAKFIGAASVAALLTFHSTATLAETNDLVTVTVVGSGANEAEARLDAIRQATQQVASQVVVAERRIVDDEVVYDNVMSTMNGFVHDFTELGVTKSGTEVQIKAEVVVSGSLMRDFASGQASSVAVDGGGMFGELLRSKSQAEVHQKMFESIWRRHTDGIEAKIALKDFEQDYGRFTLSLKWSADFIKSLEDFFTEASYATCPAPVNYWDTLDGINEEVASGKCVGNNIGKDEIADRWLQSKNRLRNLDLSLYGTSFISYCSSNRQATCFLIDIISMDLGIRSYADQIVSNNYSQPVTDIEGDANVAQYYNSDGSTNTDCSKESTTLPQGNNQLLLVGPVRNFPKETVKLSLVDAEGDELASFEKLIPLRTLTQRSPWQVQEDRVWAGVFSLYNGCYDLIVPLDEVELQRVSSVSATIVSLVEQ